MIAVHDRALPEGWFSYPDIDDHDVPRSRIESDLVLGPCWFRLQYRDAYAEAASGWLHAEAEVIDTTRLTPAQVAARVADAVTS